MKNIKEFVMECCRTEFLKSEKVYCKSLGIKASTAAIFKIGIVPSEGLEQILKNAGYSSDEILSLNVSGLENRFCFPSRTLDGKIAAFYFRRSDTASQPIWHYRIYDPSDIYGIDMANPDKEYLILCEGIKDALSFANIGISNVAGALTPKFPTDEHMNKLRKFRRIILAFDNDEFGLKFAKVVQEQLKNNGLLTASLKFDGMDISSAMKDLTQRRIIINQIKSVYSD